MARRGAGRRPGAVSGMASRSWRGRWVGSKAGQVGTAAAGDCRSGTAVMVIGLVGCRGVLWQWREAVRAIDAQEQADRQRQSRTQRNRREACTRRRAARKETELAKHRLYDVRMNHDGAALLGGLDLTRLLGRLDEQLPANQGGIDRRGFEWFYWQRKMSSGHITLKGHTSRVTAWRSAPTASGSPPRGLEDGEGVGRRDRPGNPHPQGAHRLGHERGIQPRRPAARLRQSGETVKVWDARPLDASRTDPPNPTLRERRVTTPGMTTWGRV